MHWVAKLLSWHSTDSICAFNLHACCKVRSRVCMLQQHCVLLEVQKPVVFYRSQSRQCAQCAVHRGTAAAAGAVTLYLRNGSVYDIATAYRIVRVVNEIWWCTAHTAMGQEQSSLQGPAKQTHCQAARIAQTCVFLVRRAPHTLRYTPFKLRVTAQQIETRLFPPS
jgi:hypothetical protein